MSEHAVLYVCVVVYSHVLCLTADENTCFFHVFPPRRSSHLLLITLPSLYRASLYSTSLQCPSALRCGLVSPGTPSVLFTQAWICTLFDRAYDGKQTGKVVHSGPASAASATVMSGWVCSILSHFVTDQRLRTEGRRGDCMRALNGVFVQANVGGQQQVGEFAMTYLRQILRHPAPSHPLYHCGS